jgi:hypothetical protein
VNITFDVNLWNLGMFILSLIALVSARSKATSENVAQVRKDLEARMEDHREKVGRTFNRMGERLSAVEQWQLNAITDQDIAAVHKRIDAMHTDLMKELGTISKNVAKMEGFLEGRAAPTKN